jgi:glycosyltransferase involved in cell wall biosynthesis
MLAGTGFAGPRIEPVLLPTEVQPADADRIDLARERLTVASLPLVLVVGSHEPRKNHLAVLHAAETLWREGHRFSLSLIGGNAWKSEPFYERLNQLVADGRPIEAISQATDDLLWGGYRVARFTVFPSLNEGFGLPLAESLGCGTPAITSNFGALKEIAETGGGALLVDPRDDRSLTDAMRALLTDEELLHRLRREAIARPTRTWDDYADRVWKVLTDHS